MNSADNNQKNRKSFDGQVVSRKLEQTATILVESKKPHPKYKKYISNSKKFLVHVPSDIECNVGDVVTVEECAPISKRKNFIVKAIAKKGVN